MTAIYSTRSAALLVTRAVLIIAGLLQGVYGHLYMMTPVSRNLWGTTAFNDASYEYINYCPHCYQSRGPAMIRARAESLTDPTELARYGNGAWPLLTAFEMGEVAANGNYLESDTISVRHGICGDPEQTSGEGSNRYGRANTNYPVLETYTEGSILEIKLVASTTHMGHLEFFLCNTADMDDPDGVVTQGCFNMHPLDRAEDDGVASPIDPNFPGRYYLDPSCRAAETDQTLLPGAVAGDVATARYQLPPGVTCSRCILQMVYYTGNSCMHVGYDEFNPASWPSECAPSKEDWIVTGLGMCGDGDNYPEEYWNCADIEITADGSPSISAPAPTPVAESSTELETPAPIYETSEPETPAPVYVTPAMSETPAPVYETSESQTPAPVDVVATIPGTPAPVDKGTSKPETPGRVYNTTAPETPAPVIEETIEAETPSPSPREAEFFNEPMVLTLPPATFAPSVVATEMPPDECDDPIAAYGQCGGDSYEGSSCCRPGYECTPVADCYSECRFINEDACSEGWGQCGGRNWEGPTCCWPGAECLERNEWYSQCVPETRV